MSFSQSTIDKLADSMRSDFSEYLNLNYNGEISELLAEASGRFLEENLGDADEQLICDLMESLIKDITL